LHGNRRFFNGKCIFLKICTLGSATFKPEHHFGVGISSHSLTTLNCGHRFKMNFKLTIFLGSQAHAPRLIC
jgi:hypothetical protein